jgi:hypothetical protein
MRNSFLIVMAVAASGATGAYAQVGFEQYYYLQERTPVDFVPIVHVQNRKNWYAEARYNYEEQNSFSIYTGKSFTTSKADLDYTLTPISGIVTGRFEGASIGLNMLAEYRGFFFGSQSQLTASFQKPEEDFFFAWYEIAYELKPWIYFGGSMQHTSYVRTGKNLVEPGVVLGFTLGKWTFPVYGFSPLTEDRYFVVGINHEIGTLNNDR